MLLSLVEKQFLNYFIIEISASLDFLLILVAIIVLSTHNNDHPRKSGMLPWLVLWFLGQCVFPHFANAGKGFPVMVETFQEHSCAIIYGNVLCWGQYFNPSGTLGVSGALGPRFTSNVGDGIGVKMSNLPFLFFDTTAKAIQISGASNFFAGDYSCALFDDHSVRCWGKFTTFKDGVSVIFAGDTSGYPYEPFVSKIAQITKSNYALTAGGEVINFTSIGVESPPLVFAEPTLWVTQLVTPPYPWKICAVFSNAKARCWSETATASDLILMPFISFLETDAQVSTIDTNGETTCVLLVGGSIKCWGRTPYNGALWDIDEYEIPTLPSLIFGDSVPATQLSLGDICSCALFGPKIRCWGITENDQGWMCGDPTEGTINPLSSNQYVYFNTQGTSRIIQISRDGTNTCVVFETEQIACFGANNYEGGMGRDDQQNAVRSTETKVIDFGMSLIEILPSSGFSSTTNTVTLFGNRFQKLYKLYHPTRSRK